MNLKSCVIVVSCVSLLVFGSGCEAFVRKFTRKPKKDLPKEEMVLEPQEYQRPKLSKEEEYRQCLLYWQSWQDELIASLSGNTNRKKQLDCAGEALSNLLRLRSLLDEEAQKGLDAQVAKLKDLIAAIEADAYGSDSEKHRYAAERIRVNVLKGFSYQKMKAHLL